MLEEKDYLQPCQGTKCKSVFLTAVLNELNLCYLSVNNLKTVMLIDKGYQRIALMLQVSIMYSVDRLIIKIWKYNLN